MDGEKIFKNIIIVGCLFGGFAALEGSSESSVNGCDGAGIVEEIMETILANERNGEYKVKQFLDGGENHNAKEIYGSLLSHGAYNGCKKIVQLLLDQGANPNCDSHGNCPPLCGAVRGGHYKIAKLLLKHGTNPNQLDEHGQSALANVARADLAMIKLLLKYGTDPNLGNIKPLAAIAAEISFSEGIHMLIDGGANVDAKQNYSGDTALHRAAENGKYRNVNALLLRGANVNSLNKFCQTPLDSALIGRGRLREFPLFRNPKWPILRKYKKTIALLLAHGAVTAEELHPEDTRIENDANPSGGIEPKNATEIEVEENVN
jgi:hypothetical protein